MIPRFFLCFLLDGKFSFLSEFVFFLKTLFVEGWLCARLGWCPLGYCLSALEHVCEVRAASRCISQAGPRVVEGGTRL